MAKAGRPSGSESKNTKFLMNRLKEMYGEDFEPVMMAAKNAKHMQDIADSEEAKALELNDRIDMHKKTAETWDRVSQYTNPKLKAIELSGEIEVSSHEAWLKELTNE